MVTSPNVPVVCLPQLGRQVLRGMQRKWRLPRMRLLPTERDIPFCHSKPEIRQIMDIGIFILRVAADCRVQGRNWTLPGVAYLRLS